MKKVAILQSNYIPWKGYFDLINMVDEFVIYDDVQYTKNDWRNRNKIKTSSGVQWLTIPVRQETLSQRICDTKISQNNWGVKHWNTLKTNYAKSKYFNFFSPVFEKLYKDTRSEWLTEVNCAFILTINKILEIGTTISMSSDYKLSGDKVERLVGLCKQARATEYISGPSAKKYIHEDIFKDAGIKLTWMDYSNYSEYSQLYSPFEHGVTILDLLFNCGSSATQYMKSFNL